MSRVLLFHAVPVETAILHMAVTAPLSRGGGSFIFKFLRRSECIGLFLVYLTNDLHCTRLIVSSVKMI
jgi:hypothetical protein